MDIPFRHHCNQAERVLARAPGSMESRLVHDDPSGRPPVAVALGPPFLLPRRGPATEGEREALRLPPPIRRRASRPPGRNRPGPGKGNPR